MSRSPSQVLKSDDLVDVGTVCTGLAVTVDNVYAKPEHPDNHFLVKGFAIYKASYAEDRAPLWLHHSLAKIIADAAGYLQSLNQGYSIALKDGFRPMEAQKAMELSMLETYAGKTIPATLVSQPGQGAHPKGMAIDIMLLKNGVEVDAGTPFDFFDVVEKDGTLIVNDPPRSARIHPDTDKNPEQRENQRILEGAVMRAALASGTLIMPLEDEHWDFRFPTNEQSLKFVLKSIARIIRVNIPEEKNIDTHSYDDFKRLWTELFSDHNDALLKELGTTTPPKTAPLYSIDYYPLMDTDLPPNQQMTDGKFKFSTIAHLRDHGLEDKVRPPSAITKK